MHFQGLGSESCYTSPTEQLCDYDEFTYLTNQKNLQVISICLDEVPFFPEDFCLSYKVNHVLTGINSIYSKQTLAL